MTSVQIPLRVAVVGSGPAGAYTVRHLLHRDPAAEVELIDRLPTPWGLVRSGVAPDHQKTKRVIRTFEWAAGSPRLHMHLNVEVGRDISHEELLAHHHAVVYAVGAPDNRHLGIPGEHLPGSHAATDFVAWYNGHPDYRDTAFDLSTDRAVIIGNGNVALDVARILCLSPEELRRTDIAEHALAALSDSAVREVVVLGRRGPAQAAFTSPELLALTHLSDVDVVVDPAEARLDRFSERWLASGTAGFGPRLKSDLVREIAGRASAGRPKRIVLRFLGSPVEILGDRRVERIVLARNEIVEGDRGLSAHPVGESETLDTGLVLRSIGYRGRPIDGVPFDPRRSVIPNSNGRVVDSNGQIVPGVYATGWIKRGPSGVIGTNKRCAGETVRALLDDRAAGHLVEPRGDGVALRRLIAERVPAPVDRRGWTAIDQHERAAGRRAGRPRLKVTDVGEMLRIADTRPRSRPTEATVRDAT